MSNSPPNPPNPLDHITNNFHHLHANTCTLHHTSTHPTPSAKFIPTPHPFSNHSSINRSSTSPHPTTSSLHSPYNDSSSSFDLSRSQSMSSFSTNSSSTLTFPASIHTNRLPNEMHSIPDRLSDERLSICTLDTVQPLDTCSNTDSILLEAAIVDPCLGNSLDDYASQSTEFTNTVVTSKKLPSIQSASTQTPSLEYMPSSDQVPLHLDPEVDMALTEELWDMYEKLRPSEQDLMKRQILVDRLQHIFDSEWPAYKFIVHPFGSAVNTLCSRHSDLDVCLTTADEYEPTHKYAPRSLSPVDDPAFHRLSTESDRYTSKSRSISATNREHGNHKHNGQCPDMYMRNPSEMMVDIAAILKKHGFCDIDLRKARARVPVIRFVDGDLNISCDININNPLALHNTLFVRHYVMYHPLVAPFMVLVKYWTQTRVLNDASAGSLSSYCWTIMMIYFLQQCKIVPVHPFNAILPDLALWEATRSSPKHPGDGLRMPPVPSHQSLIITGPPLVFRCPVSGDCPPDGEHAPRINHSGGTSPMTPPTMTLGALYYAFFRFFCMEFTYDTTVVGLRGLETIDWDAVQTMVRDHAQVTQVALDTGKMHKQLKLWAVTQLPPRDYRPLCVEDPLNPMRNLANNACLATVMGIQKEMWRVVYILSTKPVYFNDLKTGSGTLHCLSASADAGSGQSCFGTQTETFDADDWLIGELPDSCNLDEHQYDLQPTLYLRRLCEKVQFPRSAPSGHRIPPYPVLANYPIAAPIGIPQPSSVVSPMVYSNMMPVASPIFSMLPITRSVHTAARSSDSSDTTESSYDEDNDTLSNRFTSATDATDSSTGSSNLTLISSPQFQDLLSSSHQPTALLTFAPSADVNASSATDLWCYYMVHPIAHQAPTISLPPPSIPSLQKSYLSKLANNNQFRHDSVHSLSHGSHHETMNDHMSQYSQTRSSRPVVRQSHVKSYTDLSYLANNSTAFTDFEMAQARKIHRSIPRRDYLANSVTHKRSMNDTGTYFSGQNGPGVYQGNSLALDNNGLYSSQHVLAHQIQFVTRLVDVGLCPPVSSEQVLPVNAGSQFATHDHVEEAPRAPAPLSRATSPTSAVSPTFAMYPVIAQSGNNARGTDFGESCGVGPPMYNKRYSWSAEAGDLIISSHTGPHTKPIWHAAAKRHVSHPQVHGVRRTLHTNDLLQQEQNELEVRMSKLHCISPGTVRAQAVDAYEKPRIAKKNGVIRAAISPTEASSSSHQSKQAKAALIPNTVIRAESPTNISADDHVFRIEEQVACSKSPLLQTGCSSATAALPKTPMFNPQFDGRLPISWAQVVSSTSPLVGVHARQTVSNSVSPASTSPSKVHPSVQLKSWQG